MSFQRALPFRAAFARTQVDTESSLSGYARELCETKKNPPV